MVFIERDDVCWHTSKKSMLVPQRLRPAVERCLEQPPRDRRVLVAAQKVARPVREPLAIFERAKLLRRVDQDVGICARRDAPVRAEIANGRKDAIAQIGLRNGA